MKKRKLKKEYKIILSIILLILIDTLFNEISPYYIGLYNIGLYFIKYLIYLFIIFINSK